MADEKPQFITPPNTLKSKAVKVETGGMDLEALERAEAVIANLQDSYLDWVQEDIIKLTDLVNKAAGDPANRRKYCQEIFQVAHDVKGQGGSFGYQLVTIIGNQLCRLLEKVSDLTETHVSAARLHVDAIKLVIGQRMQGDGGKMGEALVDGLVKVIAKLNA